MVEPTLEFIGKQLERLIGDVATIRDEQIVQGAMLSRLDSRIGGVEAVVLAELRSLHNHLGRMDQRVRKLEDAE